MEEKHGSKRSAGSPLQANSLRAIGFVCASDGYKDGHASGRIKGKERMIYALAFSELGGGGVAIRAL
jgi:hypothetical protein